MNQGAGPPDGHVEYKCLNCSQINILQRHNRGPRAGVAAGHCGEEGKTKEAVCLVSRSGRVSVENNKVDEGGRGRWGKRRLVAVLISVSLVFKTLAGYLFTVSWEAASALPGRYRQTPSRGGTEESVEGGGESPG